MTRGSLWKVLCGWDGESVTKSNKCVKVLKTCKLSINNVTIEHSRNTVKQR